MNMFTVRYYSMKRIKMSKKAILALVIFVLLAGCSKATDQELWDKLNTAMAQEKDNWDVKTLETIHELAKRNNSQISQPDFMNRVTTVAVEWIDIKANWTADKERSAAMEKVLKRIDSASLLTSLGKKIKEPQKRRKTLALAEKFKISGYEGHFLTMLSEQADQRMAEDFLYSGNRALSDAGKQWLERKPNAIDNIVFEGAGYLSDEAAWINKTEGRRIYDILKTVRGEVVVDSLARHVLKPEIRLRALFLGVKLGISGTEERLNHILVERGDKRMAEDFLNAGSQKLYDGGRAWANTHGYNILTGMGSHRVSWGTF